MNFTGIIIPFHIVLFWMIRYGSNRGVRNGTTGVCQPTNCPGTFGTVLRLFKDTLRGFGLIEDVEGIKVKRKWLRRFEVTRIGWNYPKNRLLKLKIHPYGQNVKFLFTKPVKLSYISYIEMTFWLFYRHLKDLSCKT